MMAVDIKTFNEKGISPAKYYNKTSDIIEFLSSEKKAFTFDEVSIATNVDISNKKAVHNFTGLLNIFTKMNRYTLMIRSPLAPLLLFVDPLVSLSKRQKKRGIKPPT